MMSIRTISRLMNAILKDPKIYSSSAKNCSTHTRCSTVSKCASTSARRGKQQTYADGEKVDDCHQDQEHGDPDRIVHAFTNTPLQNSYAIVVVKLYRIGDSHKLLSGKNRIRKPMISIRNRSSRSLISQRAVMKSKTYQYIQPTARPTPRSTNRRGNSIIGALTGRRAVISPRHEMTDEITVPMRM